MSVEYIFGSASVRILFSLVIGYAAFRLIANQKKVFSKPTEPAKRPRWFFGLWVFLTFVFLFSVPLTGSAQGMSVVDQIILKLGMYLMFLPVGIVGFLIYKFVVRAKASKAAPINKPPVQKQSIKNNVTADRSEPTSAAVKPKSINDKEFFLQATKEVENSNQQEAMWAKAMTLCEGDESKAKYKYITLRVIELTEEFTKNKATNG